MVDEKEKKNFFDAFVKDEDDNMDDSATVIAWLEWCEKEKVKPWEYDFLQYSFCRNEKNKNENFWNPKTPVGRLLGKEKMLTKGNGYAGYKKEAEDVDLAQAIYMVLWGIHSKHAKDGNDVDADVMNSFSTPFLKFFNEGDFILGLNKYSDYQFRAAKDDKGFNSYEEKQRQDFKDYCKKNNYELSDFAREKKRNFWNQFFLENLDKVPLFIERFAELIYSIGNLTVEPLGFNAGKVGDDKKSVSHGDGQTSTWYQALEKLRELDWSQELMGGSQNKDKTILNRDLGVQGFDNYCEKCYMNDYYDKSKNPLKICSPKSEGLRNYPDRESFFKSTSSAIEKRGMKMTRELYKKLRMTDPYYDNKKVKCESTGETYKQIVDGFGR